MASTGVLLGSPCQEFHLFPKLPSELRLKIWNLTLPGPRIIPIKCGVEPPSLLRPHARRPPSSSELGCTSTAPIPPLLHVCAESRVEGLRRYRLSLGIAQQPGRVLLDPEHDVLYFGPRDGFAASRAQLHTLLALASPDDLALIRHVAVSDALFRLDGSGCPCGGEGASAVAAEVVDLLRARLPALRELLFVPQDHNPVYCAQAALVEPAAPMKGIVGVVHRAVESVKGREPGWVAPECKVRVLADGGSGGKGMGF